MDAAPGCIAGTFMDGAGARFDPIPVGVVGIRAPICNGCGACRGEVHHVGCDQEECPKCRGQLVSCACSLTWRPAISPR
jgi:hypothetical protein